MKGRKISIRCWLIAGTKDMFTNQDGSSINITVIEVLQENGTDLLFFTVDNTLYYTYPSCITKFNPNTKNTK